MWCVTLSHCHYLYSRISIKTFYTWQGAAEWHESFRENVKIVAKCGKKWFVNELAGSWMTIIQLRYWLAGRGKWYHNSWTLTSKKSKYTIKMIRTLLNEKTVLLLFLTFSSFSGEAGKFLSLKYNCLQKC